WPAAPSQGAPPGPRRRRAWARRRLRTRSRLQRWLGKLSKCRPAQHKGVLRSRLVAQLTQMLQMIISITRFSGTSRAESSGRRAGMFAKVRITAERTGDGALLLRSADELGD